MAIVFGGDAIDDPFEVLECLLFPPACFVSADARLGRER